VGDRWEELLVGLLEVAAHLVLLLLGAPGFGGESGFFTDRFRLTAASGLRMEGVSS
jgi:hypothetical protein